MIGPVRWGLVGWGSLAQKRLAPAFASSTTSTLTAVATPRREASPSASFDGVSMVGSLEELLSDATIDAVYIASPNALHLEHALAALSAGKHVLCEKPMGISHEECTVLINESERVGKELGVGFNNRFNPVHRDLQKVIRDGTVGRPILLSVEFSLRTNRQGWRRDRSVAGGGAIVDLGIHCIDLARFVLDDEIVEVSALVDQDELGLDQSVLATLRFAGGAFGLLRASSLTPFSRNGIAVTGAGGLALADDTLVPQQLGFLPESGYLEVRTADSCTRSAFGPLDVYREEIDAFASALQGGTAPPVTGRDGLAAQLVVEAIQESGQTRRPVKVLGTMGRASQ